MNSSIPYFVLDGLEGNYREKIFYVLNPTTLKECNPVVNYLNDVFKIFTTLLYWKKNIIFICTNIFKDEQEGGIPTHKYYILSEATLSKVEAFFKLCLKGFLEMIFIIMHTHLMGGLYLPGMLLMLPLMCS